MSSPLPVPSHIRQAVLGFLLQARSGATLFELEGLLRELSQTIAASLLQALAEALWERDCSLGRPSCPGCEEDMNRNRTEVRELQLQEGVLPLERRYWECRRCSVRLHALDLELELPATGEIGPRFGSVLCRLGVELPFGTAAEVLEEVTGRKLHGGTVHKELVRTGQALWNLEQQEAEIYAATLTPSVRKERLAELPTLRSVPHPGDILFAELDGVMTNVGADKDIKADIKKWEAQQAKAQKAGDAFSDSQPSVFRETLNGRFYRIEDIVRKPTSSGKVRSCIERSETVSVVNNPEAFRKRIYAVSERWRSSLYRLRVVLGDGAIFERRLHEELNPDVEILDFTHAKQHIYECGRILYGEGTSEARAWGRVWTETIEEAGPGPLLLHLRERLDAHKASGEEPPRKLVNLEDYVKRHRQRMRYPYFRSLGLPIATGAVESVNRQIVGDRCKRSGMGWKRSNLQALLSLRAALKSGNWAEVTAAARKVRTKRAPLPELPQPEAPSVPDEPWPEDLLQPANKKACLPPPRKVRGPPEWKTARRLAAGLLSKEGDELSPGKRLAA